MRARDHALVLAAPARLHARRNTLIATERERGDVALARWPWRRGQGSIEPERLVFVDETGTATNRAPRHGWGHSSERVTMGAPHGSWQGTTFVAGQAFARLEHRLRAARQRTTETLWDEIGSLPERFEPDERTRYLANAGCAINS